MNAMEWLVRQLAWEQRLGQLRTGERDPRAAETHEAGDREVQRQAA